MILTQQHLRRKRRFGRPRIYDNDSNRTWESMTLNGTTQGPQVTLSYDADQRMTSMLRATASTGPTITTNFAYDNADRVTTITHSSSSAGALATYLYSYDAASQLTQYTGPEGTLTYTYDLSGELTNVGNARLETYSYDLNGNRNYGNYTTASDNRLTADGTYTMAYDAEGNMTSKTRISDGENWTYTWDDRNRLTQVVGKTSGGVTVTNDVFTYDVENRRIGKSVNGTQTWYSYDGQNSYADFNGIGSLTMRYLTGKALDSLYARFDGTNTGWYMDDMLGSVRQVANTSGTVLDTLTYDSYGQILSESNASNGDRFKYTSREWDSEIGQYSYRARSYSQSAGRFVSQDPKSFAGQDVNLYRYTNNRSVVATDPTGLQTLKQLIESQPEPGWRWGGEEKVVAALRWMSNAGDYANGLILPSDKAAQAWYQISQNAPNQDLIDKAAAIADYFKRINADALAASQSADNGYDTAYQMLKNKTFTAPEMKNLQTQLIKAAVDGQKLTDDIFYVQVKVMGYIITLNFRVPGPPKLQDRVFYYE
jgi:RHS repeat-associated protein